MNRLTHDRQTLTHNSAISIICKLNFTYHLFSSRGLLSGVVCSISGFKKSYGLFARCWDTLIQTNKLEVSLSVYWIFYTVVCKYECIKWITSINNVAVTTFFSCLFVCLFFVLFCFFVFKVLPNTFHVQEWLTVGNTPKTSLWFLTKCSP